MPYTITKVETTPNPNARKLIVEPSPGAIRSYFKSADAANDPLGSALFGIDGITNVLIHTKFISVCVEPGTSWKSITKAIEVVLAETT
ncbi:MAG: NifU N-terminal domain-containing protein [Phycisphaerales bacterium]|nr:NifU N-terminal domain-containing protein [Phycisphaerales bacterium]